MNINFLINYFDRLLKRIKLVVIKMKQKEAKARLKINELLKEAGWRFFHEENKPANVTVEPNVKMTIKQVNDLGEDFDKTKNGFVDFLLLDENGNPFIVLEAKSEDKSPLLGKEQARNYAKSLYIRYVILSNGNIHYFWNIEKGNPQVITAFPSYESLKDSKAFISDVSRLCKEVIESNYIALTQMPRYDEDPKFIDENSRKDFIYENGLRFLRQYQINAINALQKSAQLGNTRFLFEMATGTGKTLTSAAIIKLFLRTGNSKRVLFLVDRLELENQAKKNFVEYLKNDYKTVIYKENVEDWRKAEIVVSTVQTLLSNNKYRKVFRPTDFDLIISDEAHRSINGNSRAVFEYFIGFKLGLTATPKDYIKNVDIDSIQTKDPRAWEKRQLLDTYKTFGCESGEPTYRYSLIDGVNDPDGPFLINPIVVDARTEITTQLLSDEGYNVVSSEENTEEQYFARDFEKKFFSDETNKVFCKTFLENAKRDPITGEIGKTILFAVSRNHATKITQILNEFAELIFPGKYNSDFAMQVTSDIPNAQQYTINFQNNNLSGRTTFHESYKSSKTRICVTVGMMTTGYDCQDLLNIVLMRPIFSPTDFVQIKGRGTRKHTFELKENITGIIERTNINKDTFKLFDFFGNCEYFEEKFNYDEVIKLPRRVIRPQKENGVTYTSSTNDAIYENVDPDALTSLIMEQVGNSGMKIDRKLYEKFEETVKNDDFARRQYEQGNISAVEKYLQENIFDKPNDYINLEKLRRSINIDRKITLREILDKIFGIIPYFKSKRELIEDEFEGFSLIHEIPSEKYYEVRTFFETYLTDKEVRRIIEDRRYQMLSNCSSYSMEDLKKLGKGYMDLVVEYINDNVNINRIAG